jgi:hypothetical protein
MTIGVGMVCSNGLVLGADREVIPTQKANLTHRRKPWPAMSTEPPKTRAKTGAFQVDRHVPDKTYVVKTMASEVPDLVGDAGHLFTLSDISLVLYAPHYVPFTSLREH